MQSKQVAAFLDQSIAASLQAQNLRFKEHWEPRVLAALTPAADQTLERLAKAWQNRLATIARTVTHAAATRLRLALA